MLQNPSPGMTLHVRTKGDATAILPGVRNEINALVENVTLKDAKTLSDYMDESLLMRSSTFSLRPFASHNL